ncbi:MAG: 50S ribosomal protein L28 [Rickettsiales bacterium]|nr:50S ribosomal protein L28 [Rickettsiales bacterium]
MSRVCDLTNGGVLFGNKVSHSEIKTRRRFLPNLKRVSLRSDVLNLSFNLRITAKTLRTINKYGSLDSFLVNYGFSKLSDKGKDLRARIMKKLIKENRLSEVKIIRERKTRKESEVKTEKEKSKSKTE